ncbi:MULTISPECIES: TlpA disulfide reductase family protein [unclassified Flavobacterium]|uniref:TlpA disulfide reductase family protein n=1 Tax=unclassified Flavobacterium TaxID=196869 RepID=UPI0012AA5792|nr:MULTISPECIES: TlpA disulfide reductase family protein [unclassified Flavobacterium]MBF4484905.1 AhpC/TSA family protein [Flavobacterium sp. CSZ]QGK73688.1 redoxin domain-containing protein [Flavobacterium sp. SLB02]
MNTIKYKIFGLCLGLSLVSYTNQAQAKKAISQSYTLQGSIKGLQDGTTIELIPGATHSSEAAVAQTTSKDGKFSFTGKLKEPRLFYISFGKNKGYIPVLVENAKIKVTAEAEISKKEDQKIEFKNEIITGSKSNDYFKKETAFREELNNDYVAYHKGTEELSKLYSKARTTGNKKQMDSIGNTPEWKKFEADEKAFFAKVQSSSENLISKHKATWWGPFFMMTQYSYFTPDQKTVFAQFSETAQKSYYGQLVDKEVNPKSLVGTNVSNFTLNDKDGKGFNVKDIIAGKKYILIDFWASWCAPCRKEIPNLKTAYTTYSDKGFEILSISIDKDQKAWQKALGQENMQWHNLLDDNKVSNAFNVKTIPATYLVDSKGVIISDNLRGEALEEKLKELLKS